MSELTESDVEAGMVSLMRRGLAAPQDGGEAQSKVIIEYRELLERWHACFSYIADPRLRDETREALK